MGVEMMCIRYLCMKFETTQLKLRKKYLEGKSLLLQYVSDCQIGVKCVCFAQSASLISRNRDQRLVFTVTKSTT